MEQQLHYETKAGLLVRRNGFLNWTCPDCHISGVSRQVMRVCPICKNKNRRDGKRPNK